MMKQLSHTQSAVDLIEDINDNLQEMSSQVEVAVTDSAESLVGKLNTAFANVDGKIVLSKDTDAETFVGNLNTNFEAAEDGGGGDEPIEPDPQEDNIPTFNASKFGSEMTNTLEKVKSLSDDALLTFFVSTDHHNEKTSWNSPRTGNYGIVDVMASNQKKFIDECKTSQYSLIHVNAAISIGDTTDGMKTDFDFSKSYMKRTLNLMKKVGPPLIVAVGNHDNNVDSNTGYPRIYDEGLYDLHIKDYVGESNNSNVTYVHHKDIFTTDGVQEVKPNYYVDYANEKIRLIVLNCNGDTQYALGGSIVEQTDGRTWFYSPGTCKFLAAMFGQKVKRFTNNNSFVVELEELTSSDEGYANILPQDYKAIVVCHINPINATYGGRDLVITLINKYANKVLLYVCGHSHVDNIYLNSSLNDNAPITDKGMRVISARIGCNKFDGGSDTTYGVFGNYYASRNSSNATQDLWDVFVLNNDKTMAHFIRFGAGFDRHIHLGTTECSRNGSVTLTPSALLGKSVTWYIQKMPVVYHLITVEDSITVADVSNSGVVTIKNQAVNESGEFVDVPNGEMYFIVFCDYSENGVVKEREYWGIHVDSISS